MKSSNKHAASWQSLDQTIEDAQRYLSQLPAAELVTLTTDKKETLSFRFGVFWCDFRSSVATTGTCTLQMCPPARKLRLAELIPKFIARCRLHDPAFAQEVLELANRIREAINSPHVADSE